MTSSAIEYKTEGVVMGIVNNIYKLANVDMEISILFKYFREKLRYFYGL